MKTIFSSMKHSYFAKFGVLLIVATLVAGIVSCVPADTYELIMAENPAGAGTATDETGTSPYAENKVVDIKAVAAPCYRFVGWTAPAGTFGDANAAVTNFTMPARDVTVTANFEPVPPDHYKFYTVDWEEGLYVGKEVQLVDQFGTFNATVGDPVSFGNPVEKTIIDTGEGTPISDLNRHFTLYHLDYGEEVPMLESWQVVVKNQFGQNQELTVVGPVALAVPTQKGDHQAPECLNHYLVYDAYGPPMEDVVVELNDQFMKETVTVYEPWYFANPVEKTIVDTGEVTEIEDRDPHGHLVFYRIDSEPIDERVQIDNQFGKQTLNLTYTDTLAVPSQKISWEQPLDHFKCYGADWLEGSPPGFPVEVQLKDQFHEVDAITANVTAPVLFANPVEKSLGEGEGWTPVSNWNNHLTFYDIDYDGDWQMWEVTVSNQFDPGVVQKLWVVGPIMLAVPTQKGLHDWPADLDHFLVYYVNEWTVTPGKPEVFLWDQFDVGRFATVYEPEYFAIPVQKTDAGGPTYIKGDEHLVFYRITGGDFSIPLSIDNQFGPQSLYVWEDYEFDDFLGVPSEKIEVSGPFPAPPF